MAKAKKSRNRSNFVKLVFILVSLVALIVLALIVKNASIKTEPKAAATDCTRLQTKRVCERNNNAIDGARCVWLGGGCRNSGYAGAVDQPVYCDNYNGNSKKCNQVSVAGTKKCYYKNGKCNNR